MRKTWWLLLGALLPAAAACAQAAGSYQLSGQSPLVAGQTLYLLQGGRPLRVLDSVQADAAGAFVLRGQVPAPDVYLLRVGHANALHPVPLANQEKLAAEFGKPLPGSLSSFSVTFSGSPEVALWRQARQYRYYELSLRPVAADSRALRELATLLRAHASSYATPYLAYHHLRLQPGARPLLDSLTTRFASEQPTSPYLPLLREALAAGASLDVGAEAPDLTLAGPDGRPVALRSLRGQYVLLDFWASWCQPCRAENPSLRVAYQKFSQRKPGFTIYAVSVDDDRGRWLQAVQADALPWPQVSDLQGQRGGAGQRYGVQAVPANWLLDPEGRIVAKNLRGDALRRELTHRLR